MLGNQYKMSKHNSEYGVKPFLRNKFKGWHILGSRELDGMLNIFCQFRKDNEEGTWRGEEMYISVNGLTQSYFCREPNCYNWVSASGASCTEILLMNGQVQIFKNKFAKSSIKAPVSKNV